LIPFHNAIYMTLFSLNFKGKWMRDCFQLIEIYQIRSTDL